MERVLAGRVALVTGVSRRKGIGFAVADRLAAMGASVSEHGRCSTYRSNITPLLLRRWGCIVAQRRKATLIL